MDTTAQRKECLAFNRLTPEVILAQVESALGLACTNLCRPYNSYINRVYEIEDRDGNGMVVKFYRPGRWSRQALEDEHAFLLELAAEEIPVIAPLALHRGGTLGQYENMFFAVYPRKGGRCVDEFSDDQWLAIGRLLGRTHMVGAKKIARGRDRMHPALTTVHVPAEAMWRQAADRVIAALRGEDVPRETEIEVALVVRGSTAPAPAESAKDKPVRRRR